MSEKMDPEEVTLLMNRLLRSLADAVYAHEGYVDKFIGDAVMALFGAPLAHEDDPERAVLTGLAMHEVVARHNRTSDHPLALRVGIHVGEVVAAHLGSGGRLQYTVLGDTVNVASRLEGQAEPGSVLVSEAVYRRVEHHFEAEEVPPLTLKGKAEPVRGFRIGGVRLVSQAGRDVEAPFVGRDVELAELTRFLAIVSAGRPDLLLIEAEAGGGKTRLVEEALAGAGSALRRIVLRSTSIRLPGQRPPPSEIFAQLFPPERGSPVARALALLGPDAERHRTGVAGLDDLGDGVGTGGPEGGDPAVARQNRWVAIAALLQAAARESPLVFWVEDAHWVDEAAAEFLTFLLPALANSPVGVLLTGRPDLTGSWIPSHVRRLTLPPLEEEDARALLGDLAEDLDAENRRDLIRRSQGNPLYLEQLARSLREGGSRTGIPGTLQGLIMARIDRLDDPIQALLQMAAVLGTRFSAPLLRRMYGLEARVTDFDAALRGLEGAFLVREDPEGRDWAFLHALTQEVAYGGLLLGVRKILHESAARLGQEVFAERLTAEAPFFAHHYWQAGLPQEAAPHLWIAGRAAAEAYELAAAEEFLGRLAQAGAEDGQGVLSEEDRARFLEMYGNVLLHRGRLEEADDRFRQLEREGERVGRPEWSARGLEYLGRTAWYRGELDVAEELFERGLSRLPPDQHRIEADLHNDLGIVYYYRGRPEDAFAQHSAALELRERIGDRLGMAKSYSNIGNLLADFRDDLEGAERHYRLGLEMAEAIGDRQMQYSTLFNLATIMQDRGEWNDAVAIYRQGERLLEEIGWGHARYQNLQRQAESEIAVGRIDRALRHLQECLSLGDTILEPANRVNTRTFLFDAYLRAYADEFAAAAIADARGLVDELRVEEVLETVQLREGRWLAARGRWADAATAFGQAAAQARSQNHGSFAALAEAHQARARVRAGEPDSTLPAGEQPGQAPLRAVIDYLRADANAELEPTPAAAAGLERVADEAARLGDFALERATAERLAEVRLACGDEAGHAAALERAARAMAVIEHGLPKDLAEEFAAHPRNAALRAAAARWM
jgi:class 3 adenylate cyclase/tetratricopeptide (TPR) repeat protein